MSLDSTGALMEAVSLELKEKSNDKEIRFEILSTLSFFRNGVKRCDVQVIGSSGRIHRIETFGRDADKLFQEATRLRTLYESDMALNGSGRDT